MFTVKWGGGGQAVWTGEQIKYRPPLPPFLKILCTPLIDRKIDVYIYRERERVEKDECCIQWETWLKKRETWLKKKETRVYLYKSRLWWPWRYDWVFPNLNTATSHLSQTDSLPRLDVFFNSYLDGFLTSNPIMRTAENHSSDVGFQKPTIRSSYNYC